LKKFTAAEFGDWCDGKGDDLFVIGVEAFDSACSWITKSPDLSLQGLRDVDSTWAKIVVGPDTQGPLRRIGAPKPPFLLFRYPINGRVAVGVKTWGEQYEISNWIDAVLTGDRGFMGYDNYDNPTESHPDVEGRKLIDHLFPGSAPQGAQS